MTSRKVRVLCVYGTRPEVVKMSSIIHDFQSEPWVDLKIASTGQHRELLKQAQNYFEITPNFDLDVMQENQSLASVSSRILIGVDGILSSANPDVVLVQGDTTTVAMTALACFYRKLDFGHVEAGLRTQNLANPFPEEFNRILAGKLAKWHFAPTEWAKKNLLTEGVLEERIHVTGNTGIDALLRTAKRLGPLPLRLEPDQQMILLTLHRRENFGSPMESICLGIAEVARRFPEVKIVFPVHPNPNVRKVVNNYLSNIENVAICEPFDYPDFTAMIMAAHLVVTDSGGVQEEAPSFGKPVLVLRNDTERPEGVEAGVARIVGTETSDVVESISELLLNPDVYRSMSKAKSPYGDGNASKKIIKILKSEFNV
jgi:UDP-N-acetylglucosamine 2-epimerase (non-hydrolysing)